MDKRYDVLTALDICADCIITGDDLAPEFGQTEKLFADYSLEMGGSNCIFACQSAKLGLRTVGVGVAGRDPLGELALRSLRASGVDVEHVVSSDAMKTGLGLAFCKPGDRAIMTYLGTLDPPGLERRIIELLPRARHLHIGSYFIMNKLREEYPRIAGIAKKNGTTISLDTNWDPRETWDGGLRELLPLVDILFPNENEAMAITGRKNCEDAARELARQVPVVALKLGKRGAMVFSRDGSERFAPAVDVPVVDAIGAGDSFDAGFLSGYLEGRPLEECLRRGNVCGSMNTRATGGTSGQITRAELSALLEETGVR